MSRFSPIATSVVLFFTGCGLVTCKPVEGSSASQKAEPVEDIKLWQGGWTLVSATSNGKLEKLEDAHWIVDGDNYDIVVNGKSVEIGHKFTLDTNKKRVDVFHHWTPKGTWGGSLKGIYDVSRDRLRVTYDPTAREYPASFDAASGSKLVSFVFRRDPK